MTSKEALAFISKKAIQYIEGSYPVIDEEAFENYEKSQRVLGVLIESQRVLGVLIERDTPMKPTQYNCKVCNSRLDMPQLKEVNFCPKCGQRIDW